MVGYIICCWQLRFSLYSGAAMTKALAVVVSLYYLLVSGSVEYPMPYASCLGCCGVLPCCVSLSCSLVVLLYCSSGCPPVFFLKDLCLSEVLGFCSPFYLVHIHEALWDSLSELMHSGIACLAFQAPDLAVAFWDGLSGLWLANYDWCPPKCAYCKLSCDWLLLYPLRWTT